METDDQEGASSQDMLYSSAADRNKAPILTVLKACIAKSEIMKKGLNLLEISSGSGQHIVYFAQHFPEIQFQPSEYDEACIKSIRAFIRESCLPNILDPIEIDIVKPYTSWGTGSFSENSVCFVLNINMSHITKMKCTENLFINSQKILKPNGLLFMYGPFAFNGVISPESNVKFHKRLRREDPDFGIRDVEDLKVFGSKYGLELVSVFDMPANNNMLVWKKS